MCCVCKIKPLPGDFQVGVWSINTSFSPPSGLKLRKYHEEWFHAFDQGFGTLGTALEFANPLLQQFGELRQNLDPLRLKYVAGRILHLLA
jgi:hypothetical protein